MVNYGVIVTGTHKNESYVFYLVDFFLARYRKGSVFPFLRSRLLPLFCRLHPEDGKEEMGV